jgi:glycosyltransferase involved in cell wall biosynthesis
MKFSVVTPSLNQGQFIRDCIESVRAQSGVAWEHIVIDGCSRDGTLEILKSQPHLQWVSEPDKGQSDAINKGFRQATGDWVMWLNADDYLLPDALRKVAAHAEAHPEADVIYGDCDFVRDGVVVHRKREGDFDYNMLLFYGCYIPSTGATYYHRRVVDAGYLLDTDCKVVMDYEYYLRLADAGFKFRHLPAPLACFRWHGNNVSVVHEARRIEERWRVERFYLRRNHRSYLSNTRIMQFLMHAYRAKRAARRLCQRFSHS